MLSDFIDRKTRPLLDDAAENPGFYSPLLLTGFCGKTHAACGVLNVIAENAPPKNVHWVSAERFIIEMKYCRNHGRINDFYKFYTGIDAIYIEAINRFSESQEAAEACAKIFEHLLQADKQVIVCCWQGVEEIPISLRQIISKGAVLHLENPCTDDLKRIAKLKARAKGLNLRNKDLEVLVHLSKNVRVLEGLLYRLSCGVPLNVLWK